VDKEKEFRRAFKKKELLTTSLHDDKGIISVLKNGEVICVLKRNGEIKEAQVFGFVDDCLKKIGC
jgi:hypothetical protein